ncbi:MAG: ExbD/TolR family protein [Ferruginibacter sp.]
MASIDNSTSNRKSGNPALKKKSTTVDLTPMVDLGFILITFFVFTATILQPRAMQILMPNSSVPTANDPIAASAVLTLFIADKNQIGYYEGMPTTATKIKYTSFNNNQFRQLLNAKQKQLANAAPKRNLTVIIKPLSISNFQQYVDVLDEMHINAIKRYYLDEPTTEDKQLLAKN